MSDDAHEPGSITRHLGALGSQENSQREEAARQIWHRYRAILSSLVKKHLDQRVHRREDEDDVLQETYQSFFRRQREGEFELENRDDFWRLLVTMALRKAKNTAKKHQRERRDYRREVRSSPADDDPARVDLSLAELSASMPTPQEVASWAEELERHVIALSPELRQLALWKLDGLTHEEIAEKLDCSKRTVIRKIEQLRTEWCKE
jgi:RNA polymerase sigma factor (sigma-70 family)